LSFGHSAFEIARVTRLHAFFLILVLWAAIYLPGLGGPEIKGEEGRRILPAVTMLESGDWIVPEIGGKPYLRKPPLLNWAIAGSFGLTGARSEWTARLPSVLAVFALAATIVLLGRGRAGWMNPETALVAAVFTLTQIAMIEKGRLAEIEALYVGLSGVAIACWLAWWTGRRSPWLLWLVPGVVLGLGLLTKAPLHLLFFYAVAVAVLWRARELRLLLHPAHFVGIAIMLAIFAAWAAPFLGSEEGSRWGLKVWFEQSAGRVSGKFDWAGWATNIPRALTNHLPWLLFAPLLWRHDLGLLGEREAAMVRGVRLAVVACFFGMLLLPGVLPRYVLPLAVPFALALALAVSDPRLPPPACSLRAWWRANHALAFVIIAAACAAPVVLVLLTPREAILARGEALGSYASLLTWPLVASAGAVLLALFVWAGRMKLARPSLIAASSGALVAAAMFLFAAVAIPLQSRRDDLRPLARAIEAGVPPGEPLMIYDPDYQPVIFYLRLPYRYAPTMEEIGPDARWLLAREEKRKKLLREQPEWEVARRWPEERPQLLLLRRK
jgi:4-amino-4-deoxy-L-arabinose transferase-like glycosyltransferase